MKILDYQLILSLKKRLNWALHEARPDFLLNVLAGRETDYWWLAYPDHEIYFKYDLICNKYVLESIVNESTSRLLINKEDIVNLLKVEEGKYECENRKNSYLGGQFQKESNGRLW